MNIHTIKNRKGKIFNSVISLGGPIKYLKGKNRAWALMSPIPEIKIDAKPEMRLIL